MFPDNPQGLAILRLGVRLRFRLAKLSPDRPSCGSQSRAEIEQA